MTTHLRSHQGTGHERARANDAHRITLPGARSRTVLERARNLLPDALTVSAPVVIHHGEGAIVYDIDGRAFIDLGGGVGCLAVGHAHPRVVRAIADQAARFTHTDFTVIPYEAYVQLAERLVRTIPGTAPRKVALFNSGAEAVENAVKIARAYTGRPAVIAFDGAFHGRTYMAMTLTSKIDPYKRNFGPFVPDVYRVPYPYQYRSHLATVEETMAYCLGRLEDAFVTTVQADRVAAVIVEPVQGEGGFVVPPLQFLAEVQRICARHKILLIVDEIQTGYGRTGKMWAIEHMRVEPDLLLSGKSIASGLPLSAVVGRREVMDGVADSGIGGTCVGNPIACAAGLAVLDVIQTEGLIARAGVIGKRIAEAFLILQAESPLVGDVRGLGAMMAMELVTDRVRKTPAQAQTRNIIRRAAEHGVLLLKAGVYGNVLRILVPLVITDALLDQALGILRSAILAETQGSV